jgi:SAM-dependent methyltransferase
MSDDRKRKARENARRLRTTLSRRAHDSLVTGQFGPQAEAYVSSAVHSAGPDLDRLEAIAAARAGGRALDLGCGGGHVAYRLAPYMVSVTAYDLSEEMLAAVDRTAKERGLANVTVRQGRAERLPFGDGEFDFVATRYSAHHWGDLQAGLNEARRVLRPGGHAVFIDGLAPSRPAVDTHLQAIELLRDASHVRDYGADEWTGAVARAGFDVQSMTRYRLRLDFASWTQRMRTPPHYVQAILALQAGAPDEVRKALVIEADGSFQLDVVLLEAA